MSNRQTVFFLPVDRMDKEHKDLDTIDLEAPRLAQYMHKAWKKHQNTVYWVDINLALKKGLKFCQTRSNAIILHETLPAYCIPKVAQMETGEVIYEKVYASPRPPPKISLKHDWMKELGPKVARQTEASNQPNQTPIKEGLTFYQTRSNAIILQGTLPAYCIPKVGRLKTGEVLYEKAYMSPRPPPKISLRHDWTREEVPLGSTVDQQPEGEVVRQAKSSQSSQPNPNPR